MTEPTARRVRLSPTRLAGVRRRTGDHGDRTIAEACSIGLAYWATGSSPRGMRLTAATPFTEVLAAVDEGLRGDTGWEVGADARTITVPEGIAPDDAQLALDDLADFPDRTLGTIAAASPAAGCRPWPSGTTPRPTGTARPSWRCSASRRASGPTPSPSSTNTAH